MGVSHLPAQLGRGRAGAGSLRKCRFHHKGINEMESPHLESLGWVSPADPAFKNHFCNSTFPLFSYFFFFPKNAISLPCFLPWFLFLRPRSRISPIREVLHLTAFPSNPGFEWSRDFGEAGVRFQGYPRFSAHGSGFRNNPISDLRGHRCFAVVERMNNTPASKKKPKLIFYHGFVISN